MPNKKHFYKKWWFWLIIIIVLLGVIGAVSSPPSKTSAINPITDSNPQYSNIYTVEISGTQGLEFQGNIGGAGQSRSIEGTVPATYTIEGWPAVAVIQKKQEAGKLVVTIKKSDNVIKTQETTASYGVVTVRSS